VDPPQETNEIAYFSTQYRDELLGFDFDRNERRVPKGLVQSLQYKIDKLSMQSPPVKKKTMEPKHPEQ
jgi:hypothetical protein